MGSHAGYGRKRRGQGIYRPCSLPWAAAFLNKTAVNLLCLYSGSEMVAEPEIPLLLAPEHCIISCGCPNPIPTFTNSPFIKFLSNYPNSSVPSVPSWNPGSYNGQDVAYSTTYKWSHSLNAIFFRETSLLLCYSICLISFMALVTSWCCH